MSHGRYTEADAKSVSAVVFHVVVTCTFLPYYERLDCWLFTDHAPCLSTVHVSPMIHVSRLEPLRSNTLVMAVVAILSHTGVKLRSKLQDEVCVLKSAPNRAALRLAGRGDPGPRGRPPYAPRAGGSQFCCFDVSIASVVRSR